MAPNFTQVFGNTSTAAMQYNNINVMYQQYYAQTQQPMPANPVPYNQIVSAPYQESAEHSKKLEKK